MKYDQETREQDAALATAIGIIATGIIAMVAIAYIILTLAS